MAKATFTIGNGSDEVFDLSCGFVTSRVLIRLFDKSRDDAEIFAYGLDRQTPNASSIRLHLRPAPSIDQIEVRVSDGTEKP